MKKFENMILGCDMDGTLLDSEKRISARNEEALRYYAEQGGRFSLATGRAPGGIRQYLHQMPMNAPYSLLNGSLFLNEQHEIIRCAGMPEETKELIHATLSNFSQIGCEIYVGSEVYITQFSEETQRHMEMLDLNYHMVDLSELPDTDNWGKVNFTAKDVGLIQQVKEFLVPYQERFCMATSLPTFWEVTTLGVNKGSALQSIAQDCKIPSDRIFAVGDSYNDEQMLAVAHLGFVPENADRDILEKADIVVRSNDDDAVAAVIEYLDAHY